MSWRHKWALPSALPTLEGNFRAHQLDDAFRHREARTSGHAHPQTLIRTARRRELLLRICKPFLSTTSSRFGCSLRAALLVRQTSH